jgi:ATP-dependent DNA helicase DinG
LRSDLPTANPSLTARVNAVFADNGPLAGALEGFEPRPGQREFAEAVADTLEAGGTLVAEAGTGIGKTLAYLVPAVLSGKRVLISTGTRNLQDQVFYKDVPTVGRALNIEVNAAYMKGRTNYLCRHRFDRLQEAAAGLPASDRRWLAHIGAWLEATDTGDRSEIEDLPDHLPLWSDVTATSEQCLGRECPRYADCFVTRMRDRAALAQIVIVNHHLLCADASVRRGAFGEVIPESELAIIDEAHQLEDVVTQYFGVAVTTHRLDEFCRDAAAATGALAAREAVETRDAFGAAGAHGSPPIPPINDPRFVASVSDAVSDVERAGRRLFAALRLESGPGDRTTMSPEIAARVREPGLDVTAAIDSLVGRLTTRTELPADLTSALQRARALRDDLERLLSPDDERYVHFIEIRGRGVALRAAPIEVADIIRDSVIAGRRATVLTSATLAVDGSFEYAARRLGADSARTLRVPSEFDFRTQAILFLPDEMPDPRSPEFNRAAAWIVADLLDRTRGRAFVLFTSHAAMREVFAVVERRVTWPLFVQGSAPRTALLRDFRATPNAVLFATSSFWQGVDVAGEALSAVIIDRLPFASPGDPLVAARINALRTKGRDPFQEYQVPFATLTLLQGLGRLIRTRADRGLLAILDPRLTTKGYGRRFLGSLPPAPITSDVAAVERFLA